MSCKEINQSEGGYTSLAFDGYSDEGDVKSVDPKAARDV